jgi:RsiW-degrading membrane proteinase PrsW (M82 family)
VTLSNPIIDLPLLTIAFVLVLIFPPLIWFSYVYFYHNKTIKRFRKTVLIGLIFGMISIFPAMVLEGLFFFPFAISVVLVAPFVEEICKSIGIFSLKENIKSPFDGLILGVAAGIGFAIIEDAFYLLQYGMIDSASWAEISFLRAFSSIIHPLTTGLIGYAYANYRLRQDKSIMYLIGAFFLSIIIHASWNFFALIQSSVWIIVAIIFDVILFMFLRYLLITSKNYKIEKPNPTPTNIQCHWCNTIFIGGYCPGCGRRSGISRVITKSKTNYHLGYG